MFLFYYGGFYGSYNVMSFKAYKIVFYKWY